jgi:urea transport system substrate-binding protein
MFVNAWVPEQQVPPIVDYFAKLKGARLLPDRLGLRLRPRHAGLHQGLYREERRQGGRRGIPADGRQSDWTPILSKLRGVRPDALITSTAGGAPNVTLTKQLRAAGVTLPYGNLAVDEGTAKHGRGRRGHLHLRVLCHRHRHARRTRHFLAAMAKKFGADLKTPNDLSVPEYEAVYLYKAAVEKAGSTDHAEGREGARRGRVRRPARRSDEPQHHAPLTMYLGQVQADGSVKVMQSFKSVDPGEQCPNLK